MGAKFCKLFSVSIPLISSNGYFSVTNSFLSAFLSINTNLPIFVSKSNKLTENNHCFTKQIATMSKKTAVVAVNPVNGMGLFQYLEAFFENRIPYTVFAVSDSREIRTNSGVGLTADDVIASLKGHEEEYDALVFACGDAVPVFAQNADKPWNKDLMEVLKTFGETGKPMIGHCAAGMMFGFAGVAAGRRVAVHPMAKAAVTGPVATDAPFEIDGNFYTAQEEHAIPAMIRQVVEALK